MFGRTGNLRVLHLCVVVIANSTLLFLNSCVSPRTALRVPRPAARADLAVRYGAGWRGQVGLRVRLHHPQCFPGSVRGGHAFWTEKGGECWWSVIVILML